MSKGLEGGEWQEGGRRGGGEGTRCTGGVSDLGGEAGLALVAPLAQVGSSSASGGPGCHCCLVGTAVPPPLLQAAHLLCCL